MINTFEVYLLAVQAFVLADEPHRSHTKRVRSAYSCQIRERGLIITSISQYLDGIVEQKSVAVEDIIVLVRVLGRVAEQDVENAIQPLVRVLIEVAEQEVGVDRLRVNNRDTRLLQLSSPFSFVSVMLHPSAWKQWVLPP